MFTTLTGLAALSFSIGGYFMKLSAGTHLRPTISWFWDSKPSPPCF